MDPFSDEIDRLRADNEKLRGALRRTRQDLIDYGLDDFEETTRETLAVIDDALGIPPSVQTERQRAEAAAGDEYARTVKAARVEHDQVTWEAQARYESAVRDMSPADDRTAHWAAYHSVVTPSWTKYARVVSEANAKRDAAVAAARRA